MTSDDDEFLPGDAEMMSVLRSIVIGGVVMLATAGGAVWLLWQALKLAVRVLA